MSQYKKYYRILKMLDLVTSARSVNVILEKVDRRVAISYIKHPGRVTQE